MPGRPSYQMHKLKRTAIILRGTTHPCIASNCPHLGCTSHLHPPCSSSTCSPSSTFLEEMGLADLALEVPVQAQERETEMGTEKGMELVHRQT